GSQDMPHEVGADETGAAGHENLHGDLSFDDVPDVRAGEIPGQTALVARGGIRLELYVHEVDDAPTRGGNVLDAVGDAGRNPHEPRGAVAHGQPPRHLLRRRPCAHVDEDHEHLVA